MNAQTHQQLLDILARQNALIAQILDAEDAPVTKGIHITPDVPADTAEDAPVTTGMAIPDTRAPEVPRAMAYYGDNDCMTTRIGQWSETALRALAEAKAAMRRQCVAPVSAVATEVVQASNGKMRAVVDVDNTPPPLPSTPARLHANAVPRGQHLQWDSLRAMHSRDVVRAEDPELSHQWGYVCVVDLVALHGYSFEDACRRVDALLGTWAPSDNAQAWFRESVMRQATGLASRVTWRRNAQRMRDEDVADSYDMGRAALA